MKTSKYTRRLIGMSSLVALMVVVVNYAVDPFTYYHQPWFAMNISSNHRYGNPGLARQFDYKTALVGTSHVMELRSDKLSEIIGEPSLNLSISGGLIREQAQLVELVLRRKKAQTIIWEMNYPSFSAGDDFSNAGQYYPEYFYKPTIETPFQYLMSYDTLLQSLQALTEPHDVNVNNRNQQVSREFSKERVIDNFDKKIQRWTAKLRQTWADYRLTEETQVELLNKRVLPTINQHPNVKFKLFLSPKTMLIFLLFKHVSDDEIEQWMAYRNAIAELAEQFPNVEIYDFEVDWAINENFEKYRDLEHFNQNTLNDIFAQMSKGETRVDKVTMFANTSELRKRINSYGTVFCRGNPEHCPATLKIELD